jgi:hypothetical protein
VPLVIWSMCVGKGVTKKLLLFNAKTGHKTSIGLSKRSSVVDPDPDWIRSQSGPWIRIRIQKGKNDSQSQPKKKVNKFKFLKCWMFSFEDLRLLL